MWVAAFGDITIDVAVGIDELPSPGAEAFAGSSRIGVGGSAVNTAISLTRLGVPTRIAAQVGTDVFGDFAAAELAAAGVFTGCVLVSPTEATGFSLITVTEDGERTMVGARGANAAYGGRPDWVEGVGWLHLSGYALLAEPQRTAAREGMREAKARGIPISVDIPSEVGRVMGEKIFDDLAGARIVSTGGPALAAVAGATDPVGRLMASGVAAVAITAGGGACRLVGTGGSVTLTPPEIEPVDTTGAGDAFVAGLVAATLAGLSPGATLVVAAALGTAAVTHHGAGTALGQRSAVDQAVEARPWVDADPEWLEEAAYFLASRQTG